MPEKQQKKPCVLDTLPAEVTVLISSWLSEHDLASFARVDSFRYSILNHQLYRYNAKRDRDAILWAAAKDSAATIRHALAAGADVNAAVLSRLKRNAYWTLIIDYNRNGTPAKHTPLCIAVFLGCGESVEVLLEAGARLSVVAEPMPVTKSRIPFGALFAAAAAGHLNILKRLLKVPGADVNVKDAMGNGLLVYAVEAGRTEMSKYLLETLEDAEGNSEDGHPILHTAMVGSSKDLLPLLLDSGKLDVNKRNRRGETALLFAAYCDFKFLPMLLDRPEVDMTATDNSNRDAVIIALDMQHESCVTTLLACPRIDFDPWRTFEGACRANMTQIIGRLVRSQEVPKSLCPETGRTWMHIAARDNHKEALLALYAADKTMLNAQCSRGYTPLLEAIRTNARAAVNALIRLEADVTLATHDGETALHVACERQNKQNITGLINLGADISAKTTRGDTPLHVACRIGNVNIVRLLLEAGASVTEANTFHHTPLHTACHHHWEQIVSELCHLFPHDHPCLQSGYTPLHAAISAGHTAITNHILDLGADPAAVDPTSRMTPLALACKGGHPTIIKALLATNKVNIKEVDADGISLLHRTCCRRGWPVAATTVIKAGADVHLRHPTTSETPLHLVCRQGSPMIARALINHGADVNATIEATGATPLHTACGPNLAEDPATLVKVLLASGADPNLQRKDDGKAALHLACEMHRSEVIKMLVQGGADVLLPMSSSPCAGNTPLQKLCHSIAPDKKELMMLLIKSAKRPLTEVWTPGCWSALHDAAAAANVDAFKMLLDAGMDPDAPDDKGATPLWEVVKHRNGDNIIAIIDLLVAAGIDLNKKRPGHGTVLHYARSVQLEMPAGEKVLQCLVNHGATDV